MSELQNPSSFGPYIVASYITHLKLLSSSVLATFVFNEHKTKRSVVLIDTEHHSLLHVGI